MIIEYDESKNQSNISKHGISFERVINCNWSDPLILEDSRADYGERRYNAFVTLEGRLHNVVFTFRNECMRIISFRKANKREQHYYDQT